MEISSPKEQIPAVAPGLLRRLAAIIYDTLLIIGLVFLAITLVVLAMSSIQGLDQFDPSLLRDNPFYIAYLLSIPAVFFIWFWTRGGQTLGMRSWRVRVVTSTGGPLRLNHALLRLLAALLSWGLLGLGFLWVLVDRNRLAWHDHLSGTRLVMTGKSGE